MKELSMELRQIRYFLALAQTLNFTRAAEQCHATQPALTKAIQRLEEELGGSLVHRERRLTQLTDLGAAVLPMLQRAYASAESVRVSAAEFKRKERAPLKIILSPCVSAGIVEEPLNRIARFVPGLQVELSDCEADAVAQRLLDGQAHCAISGQQVGDVSDRIDQWLLYEEEVMVLAPAAGPVTGTDTISLAEMARASWADLIGDGSLTKLWPVLFPDGSLPRIVHRGASLNHLQHMVSAGLGLMLAPARASLLPNVVALHIAGQTLRRGTRLMAVAGRRYPPALQAFIKAARVNDCAPRTDRSTRPEASIPPTQRPLFLKVANA